VNGREAIIGFLTRKWKRELDSRLIKELWGFRENSIAVRFAYEWRDDSGNWFRSYGNENWEFGEDGLMRRRLACINDAPICDADRDIALRRRERGVAGQLLDVADTAAGRNNRPCRSSDEGTSARVRACTVKAQFGIQAMKPYLHRTRAHASIALAG
jgi:hypothetical protein